ncbi:uncharacterized protein LOC135816851 [Sycon ciliatum]|uniref:uncharacterized protein LOC135816851 n=1 Tax=Sycon ciliatum TaxID=27933 RepID=UPI0031F60746
MFPLASSASVCLSKFLPSAKRLADPIASIPHSHTTLRFFSPNVASNSKGSPTGTNAGADCSSTSEPTSNIAVSASGATTTRRLPKCLTVIVNREFDGLHSELEYVRLNRQCRYAREASAKFMGRGLPVRLQLANMSEAALKEMQNGFVKTAFSHAAIASMHTAAPWEMYPRDKLVMLTPDSDNYLQHVDLDRVYVLGGIVDLQLKVNITLKQAKEQGIAHARLPIQEYHTPTAHLALPLNHVVDILGRHALGADWKTTISDIVANTKVK